LGLGWRTFTGVGANTGTATAKGVLRGRFFAVVRSVDTGVLLGFFLSAGRAAVGVLRGVFLAVVRAVDAGALRGFFLVAACAADADVLRGFFFVAAVFLALDFDVFDFFETFLAFTAGFFRGFAFFVLALAAVLAFTFLADAFFEVVRFLVLAIITPTLGLEARYSRQTDL